MEDSRGPLKRTVVDPNFSELLKMCQMLANIISRQAVIAHASFVDNRALNSQHVFLAHIMQRLIQYCLFYDMIINAAFTEIHYNFIGKAMMIQVS